MSGRLVGLPSAPDWVCARIVAGSLEWRGAKKSAWRQCRISDEARLLQKVIGLDYLSHLIAAARVSSIRVRMVNLHQLLEARLDLDARRIARQVERLQALLLERL